MRALDSQIRVASRPRELPQPFDWHHTQEPVGEPGDGETGGFVVFDYASRHGEAVRDLTGSLREGRLQAREDVAVGTVDAVPDPLLRLFRGEDAGELVLQLAGS